MAKEEEEKDYGEPFQYDPDFHGPIRNRSCTDIIFLLLFIIMLGFWAGIGIHAISGGDIGRLLAPMNTLGNHCGYDSTVLDKPFLVFFDITRCMSITAFGGCPTPQVCVSECPTSSSLSQLLLLDPEANVEAIRREMVCRENVDLTNANTAEMLTELINSGQCAPFVLQSINVANRCIPNFVAIEPFLDQLQISDDDVSTLTGNMDLLTTANELSTMVIDDIVSSRWFLIAALVAVIVLILIYIFILRWFVCPLLWTSIILLIGLLAFTIYLCAGQYVFYRDNPIIMQNTNNIGSWIASLFQNANIWLTFTIILSILTAIMILVIIFLRERIAIAIELIKEGSKAVSSIKSTLGFPLLPWVFQLITIVYVVVVLAFLMSMGTPVYAVIGLEGTCYNYTNYGSCEPLKFNVDCNLDCLDCTQVTCHMSGTESPPYTTAFHAANLFGFFWTLFFIQGMEGMILAATFATWYWTYNKKNVPFFTLTAGIWRSTWYHSGTVAFGSLIIAIVRMIRVLLGYIQNKLNKFDNPVTKCILCLCQCCFACLENFLRFINKNAYIMCAVHGKGFCASARDAFSLLMRNIVRVFVLDKVVDFIFFISKVLLGLGVGIGTYYLLQMEQLESWTGGERLHFYLVPSIILGASTYIISSLFFNVYSMAVDTLFLCFLEDSERNNGTMEKPYFMSKNLMKILGKRNKTID